MYPVLKSIITRENLLHFEKDLVEPKHLQSPKNNVGGKKHVQNVWFPRAKLLDNAITPYIISVLPKLKADVPPTNDAVHKECYGEDDLATKDEFAIPGIFLHMGREEYFQITKYQENTRKFAQAHKEDGIVMNKLVLER